MRIVSSLVEDFGGFELDISAIELRSVKKREIMLKYNGGLPVRMLPASSAFLQVNVQLIQGAVLVLVVKRNGKEIRRPVDATNQEVIELMDRFFLQEDTGLKEFWRGHEYANYSEWREVALNFRRLMKILETLPVDKKAYISKRLLK